MTKINGIRYIPEAPETRAITPQNCTESCPYGHGRAFCFPCYKRILLDHYKKKNSANRVREEREDIGHETVQAEI